MAGKSIFARVVMLRENIHGQRSNNSLQILRCCITMFIL